MNHPYTRFIDDIKLNEEYIVLYSKNATLMGINIHSGQYKGLSIDLGQALQTTGSCKVKPFTGAF
jgi:hypothetical protein